MKIISLLVLVVFLFEFSCANFIKCALQESNTYPPKQKDSEEFVAFSFPKLKKGILTILDKDFYSKPTHYDRKMFVAKHITSIIENYPINLVLTTKNDADAEEVVQKFYRKNSDATSAASIISKVWVEFFSDMHQTFIIKLNIPGGYFNVVYQYDLDEVTSGFYYKDGFVATYSPCRQYAKTLILLA